MDLSGTDLRGALLIRTYLVEAKLAGCNLENASLGGAFLNGADFSEANLTGATLGSTTLVDTKFSGARLCGSYLNQSLCIRTQFDGANLEGSNLHATTLVQANFESANLNNSLVYGIAAWGLNLTRATQSDLVISLPNEPLITVDNLEVAQFVYLLLTNEKIRSVIDTITTKVVLILGRFTPERKAVLDAIREELRTRDYCPVMFDFDRPRSRSFVETVSTLAHMARFVVADFSDAKTVLHEVPHIMQNLAIPVLPLMHQGAEAEPPTLFDLRKGRNHILPMHRYTGVSDLIASLGRLIAQAEKEAVALSLTTTGLR
ncbi:MAG: pentapeptide repeat-containing protein [Planctomycetes bacterium]|nr:pentapeptide repeat-containing protein [Planctomycetota bacterium]